MHPHIIKSLLLAVATTQRVYAHTTFTNFFVDGAPQIDGKCVRMSTNIHEASYPIKDITSNDMACGVDGQTGVARVCPANAGSTLTFEYRTWPDGSHPGLSIDWSHKGPCEVYMKKVDSAIANNNAAGDGWFRIFAEDYDSSAGKWCTEKLLDNNGHLSVSVPNDIEAGYYLVRPELLALHNSNKSPPDPQFYVGCAQIFLTSSGTATPKDTVSIPGFVDMNKNAAAMTFNIYNQPMALPYPMFGPTVYTGSSKRSLETRDKMTQTEGLKPANCVLENSNWCGIEMKSYSDETGCWNASSDCWAQDKICWSSAGPVGGANCKIWEQKCQGIQDACTAKNFNGPPNAGKDLTPVLSMNKNLPPPANKISGSSGSANTAVVESSSAATPVSAAAPMASSTSADAYTPASSSTSADAYAATSSSAAAYVPMSSSTPSATYVSVASSAPAAASTSVDSYTPPAAPADPSQPAAPAEPAAPAAPAAPAQPAAPAVPAQPASPAAPYGNQKSIDQCGSNNGGATCATGMCCSSHGYCGTSSDYCGASCQSGFGKCMSYSSKFRKSYGHGHGHRHNKRGI